MSFRLQARHLFITYPQADAIPSAEALLSHLQAKLPPIQHYVIGEELHQDGATHYHAYLRLQRKCNIRAANHLDFMGCHPNIQSAHNPTASATYCRKEGSYIESPISGVGNHSPRRSRGGAGGEAGGGGDEPRRERDRDRGGRGDPGEYLELARGGDANGAIWTFAERYPMQYTINKPRVEANLRALAHANTDTEPDFKRDDFNLVPLDFKWDPTKSLILSGPTGTGKTKFAQCLAGPRSIFVRHIDKLKEFAEGQTIIFDDMNFSHWPRESVINLVDVGEESQINVKHSMVVIPKGTPKIFTTNLSFEEIFPLDPHNAIKRRVQFERFDDMLFDKEQPPSPIRILID